MARNPLIRRRPRMTGKTTGGHKSAGILDDHAVRKNVATKEGTIEHVPTQDNHIANKKYVDDNAGGVSDHALLSNVTSDQHHPQTHTIVSHDTTATGTNLTDLTNGSVTSLHSHATTTPDHGNLLGLGDDDHTQYVLEAGRSGGQDIIGGTAASEDLTLESTSHATKGEIIVKDDVMPDVDATIDLGTGANSFQKMHASTGFSMTTIGGTCARIPANSYFAGIDGQPSSGIYFDNVTPKGISIHLAGVEKHMFHIGLANSEGAFYHLLRTADPTNTNIRDGTLVMVKSGGTYFLKVYDSVANSWKTLSSV